MCNILARSKNYYLAHQFEKYHLEKNVFKWKGDNWKDLQYLAIFRFLSISIIVSRLKTIQNVRDYEKAGILLQGHRYFEGYNFKIIPNFDLKFSGFIIRKIIIIFRWKKMWLRWTGYKYLPLRKQMSSFTLVFHHHYHFQLWRSTPLSMIEFCCMLINVYIFQFVF